MPEKVAKGGRRLVEHVTRGIIEKLIDDELKGGIVEDIDWVSECTLIQSRRDLAIGYAVGALEATAISMTAASMALNKTEKKVTRKVPEEIRAMIKRRIPEIIQKITQELNR